MIALLSSVSFFLYVLAAFAVGAVVSLVFRNRDAAANGWSSFFAIVGSLGGLAFSSAVLLAQTTVTGGFVSSLFPLLSFSIHVDTLSAFFIFVISLIALFCSIYGVGYVRHFYKKYSLGTLGFFYHTFIAGMLLVVTASNGLFFLLAWELMAVASYFLVVYDRNDAQNVKAGFVYLVMTHVATAFIVVALLLLYKVTGSFDFAVIKASAAAIPAVIKNAVFVLSLIGFGTKAGIIPLHVWLPGAHPAAPSHVSALMSGVMIKTGIYMMIRVFFDLLQPVPTWWGLTILVVGAVSSLLGVLYALTEHDIKRLLAYHSIENIGIILLGVGSGLTFASLNMPVLAILGLSAALFHTLNHATFKSLLFLSAGSVINQMHTRNMEEYGGLIKYMPQTALFFLIGSMAISALPPFNGFFSEWLTFQSLFQGIAQLTAGAQWIFIIAAGSLAFTGGLALACFVKAFGAMFLARPRSEEVKHAHESSWSLRAGMGALALLTLVFGVFSGYVTTFLDAIGAELGFVSTATTVNTAAISVGNGFSSVSGPVLFALLVVASAVVYGLVTWVINRKQKIVIGRTWDCGVDLTPRMEITATGFSRSIIVIFKGILKPSLQQEIDYQDAASRYLPKSRAVVLGIRDVYHTYIYHPLQQAITAISLRARRLQSGNVNAYISYIFIALIIALLWVL